MHEYLSRHDREYDELESTLKKAEIYEPSKVPELQRRFDALHKKIIAEEQEKTRIQRDLDLTRKEEESLRRSLAAKKDALRELTDSESNRIS